MNKRVLTICIASMSLFTLAGCGNHTTDSTGAATSEITEEAATEAASEAATDEPAAGDHKVISPVDSWLSSADLETLDDCTVAVSFTLDDLYTIESGDLALDCTIYDYDLYDMVDISQMQVGDDIVIQGTQVNIGALDTDDQGTILINGGIEEGGYSLTSDGETVYYATTWDDLKLYNEIGQTTKTISADLVMTDSSMLDSSDTVTYTLEDLENKTMTDHFVPNNTTIRIEGGAIVEITRVYNP